MAKKDKLHVVMELPADIRSFLLKKFPPAFDEVYCRYITLAYGVGADFPITGKPQKVTVYGYHKGLDADALLVDIGGEMFQPRRPDEPYRRPYHITLSVRQGMPPKIAGEIETSRIEFLKESYEMQLTARRKPRWVTKAELRKAA